MEIDNSCEGIFGKIFGHKFRGRYSTFEHSSIDGKTITSENLAECIRAHKLVDEIYQYDICTRCGKTIKKEN